MNNLFLRILTCHSLKSIDKCQRYGQLNAHGSSFEMAPSPDDRIYVYTPTEAANTAAYCMGVSFCMRYRALNSNLGLGHVTDHGNQ